MNRTRPPVTRCRGQTFSRDPTATFAAVTAAPTSHSIGGAILTFRRTTPPGTRPRVWHSRRREARRGQERDPGQPVAARRRRDRRGARPAGAAQLLLPGGRCQRRGDEAASSCHRARSRVYGAAARGSRAPVPDRNWPLGPAAGSEIPADRRRARPLRGARTSPRHPAAGISRGARDGRRARDGTNHETRGEV